MDGQPTMAITVEELSFEYGEKRVLSNLSFTVSNKGFTGIIGPNGSGKTTLLRCIDKTLIPNNGRITLNGKDLSGLNIRTLARLMGVVPQKWEANFSFTAQEVVMMGRFPHLKPFARERREDWEIGREAMQATNTWELADRPIAEMSGGELQRVIIAQALAQTPRILLLDEPTSHLDINYSLEICELLRKLVRTKDLTILAVFHDLNLASRYCDALVLLKEGKVFAQGAPEEVLTAENLETVFGVKTIIQQETYTGKPHIFFFPK
ncbi:MAG TPA: ABC transporter [Firmicutes bacterium]|jgi:iron complex transport system ATP-binding protein|nr:ABC transporter [Bacillota bacterium]HBT17938.1 ABC transporter [Bacillota bacterium]